MNRLLSANLSRLWINKAFWITLLIMVTIESLICILLSRQDLLPMDFVLYLSLPILGVLISVCYSLFLGTEYSEGTIRNKLIVGHKRSSIYLASLITGVVEMTMVYLAGVLTGIVFGCFIFAAPHYGYSQIMVAGIIGWLAGVSYISIFTLVGMLSSSKAKTSIICILTAFIIMFVGLLVYALLQGMPSAILLFLFEFSPFGQAVQAMSITIESAWRLTLYALVLTLGLTGIGLYAFCRKDLK